MSEKKSTGFWAFIVKMALKVLPILAKFTKLIKLGLLVASFAAYAYLFTWKFALLIIIAIAWHEGGHLLSAKQMGLRTKGMFLIPFIGGAAVIADSFKTFGQHAYVAIMGPVAGLLLAAATCAMYYITGVPTFAAAAGFMALLNIFNLLIIWPLDGGQILRAITFSINKTAGLVFLFISFLASIILTIKFHVFLFGLFIIFGAVDLLLEMHKRRQWKQYNESRDALERIHDDMKTEYPTLPDLPRREVAAVLQTPMNVKQLAMIISAYVATVVALIVIMKLMAVVPGADLAAQFLAS